MPPRKIPRTRPEIGRAARRKGVAWQRLCAEALRTAGYPAAEVVPSNGRGDITGCGDINVECKADADWRNLSAHIAQSEGDAQARDLPDACVWKKRNGAADPLDGYVITGARGFWEMRAEYDRLQLVELEYAALARRIAVSTEAERLMMVAAARAIKSK
jgi:hypothetical protein